MSEPVFECETAGVLVRAEPCFLEQESDPDEARFVWAYTIEIANLRPEPVQLLNRYWRITDGIGLTHEVRGPGVIGKQPTIDPGGAFRYTSACPLSTPNGMMHGVYDMVDSEGEHFEVTIPAFSLDSPFAQRLAN